MYPINKTKKFIDDTRPKIHMTLNRYPDVGTVFKLAWEEIEGRGRPTRFREKIYSCQGKGVPRKNKPNLRVKRA